MAYPSFFVDMPHEPPVGMNPPIAVRVVSGVVWDILYRQWRDYKQGHAPQPRLGPPSAQQIFFSDPASLVVCTDAEDFALRLTLAMPDLQDIRHSGCALIFFPPPTNIERPSPTRVHGMTPQSGLTVGGAREWVVLANLSLDLSSMEVFFVNRNRRWGPALHDIQT